MKVSYINQIPFKSGISNSTPVFECNKSKQKEIKEINNMTPDYAVTLPQKYAKIGVDVLDNGLEVHSYKLANGHRVTIVPMENSPAIVKNYVNVGSLNETDNIKGISHFLEHMAFNGTIGDNGYIKLNTGDSFKKIEKLGGWTNASTSYAVTDYVNSTPLLENKDIDEQIKIIAAMTENLALTDDMIEKEKGPVCSEINMIMDDPTTIAMDTTVRNLFGIESSADELIAGSVNHIKNLTRNDVKDYYEKYYTPDNMNLVITGDVEPDKIIETVAKNFKSNKKNQGNTYETKLNPIKNTIRKDLYSDKTKSSNVIIGFSSYRNNDAKESIIDCLAKNYFYTTEFGLEKEMDDLNSYPSFSTEKISTNPYNPNISFCTFECSDNKTEQLLKLVCDKLNNAQIPSEKTLNILKKDLKKSYNNTLEYSENVNNKIGNAVLNNNIDYLVNFNKIIDSITPEDVYKHIKKYYNTDKCAITVTHPQIQNTQFKGINFKGNNRQPINVEKTSVETLKNNWVLATTKTKSDNITFIVSRDFDYPQNVSPATRCILNRIYDMGTQNRTKDEFQKYSEENSLMTYITSGKRNLLIEGESDYTDFDKNFDLAMEIFYEPRINEENFAKAINELKEDLSKRQPNSIELYSENQSAINPQYVSTEQILKDIDNITLDDVKNLHKYISENSSAVISINIPETMPEFGDEIKNKIENYKTAKEFNKKTWQIYVPNKTPVVLTKEKNTTQADIIQTYKFEASYDPKEIATRALLNSILSCSSIGLFNTLREKEHLAYSVYSDVNVTGNNGEISCNILTTTDSKENGEIKYDNLQKSINGFNRQINCLKNGEFTDEDLTSSKNILKSELLNQEGNTVKIDSVLDGLKSPQKNINYKNQIYNAIDEITKEDIIKYAEKVFENPPIYSIVASKDTLDANQVFLNSLKDV